MTVFTLACSERLRDKRIQSREQTAHHGIDDGHAHPAEFGEDQRNGEPQSGAKFGAKCLESNHEREIRGTSVCGDEKRSKRRRGRNEVMKGAAAREVGADYPVGIKCRRNSCNLSLCGSGSRSICLQLGAMGTKRGTDGPSNRSNLWSVLAIKFH